MEPDVELSEITTAGLLEPKAEWTKSAKEHLGDALKDELKRRHAQLIFYQPSKKPATERAHAQLVKLHNVVGEAILTHMYEPSLRLPNKEGKFDWSLGSAVDFLREDYDAEYALFILLRDSYASTGRVAVSILEMATQPGLLINAMLGRAVPGGGIQVAFTSLVNLKTGDIVWSNRLTNPGGRLRTREHSEEVVKNLLADFPL
jgi:hypothetical protein